SGQDGGYALQTVLAHVAIHVLPAREHRSLLGRRIQHITVFNRPHSVTASGPNGLAVRNRPLPAHLRRFDAELLARSEEHTSELHAALPMSRGRMGLTPSRLFSRM